MTLLALLACRDAPAEAPVADPEPVKDAAPGCYWITEDRTGDEARYASLVDARGLVWELEVIVPWYEYFCTDESGWYRTRRVDEPDWETVDGHGTRTWDGAGFLLSETNDSCGDGVIDYETARSYTYDDAGRPVSGSCSNAVTEWITTYTWDEAGNLFAEDVDHGADGDVDVWVRRTFDSEGHALTEQEHGLGEHHAAAWTWSGGDRIAEDGAFEGDGTSYTWRIDWTFDGEGHALTEVGLESDGEGWSTTWTWDGDQLATEAWDGDADGDLDTTSTFSYEAAECP